MIDVIIAAYNCHDTILRTLLSIYMQTCKDLINVYIVNDGSDECYDREVKIFKDKLNINVIDLYKNMGPGVARQVGIDNSNSKYIMFIDSDDVFYNNKSIENIYNSIKSLDYDVSFGYMGEYNNDNYREFLVGFDVLHAKIYKREFIIKNNIRFPEIYNSEDLAFNNLVILSKPRMVKCNDYIYVYIRREKSLTTGDDYYSDKHIKYYTNSLLYVLDEAIRLNKDEYEIGKLLVSCFSYLYYYFHNNLDDYTIKYIYELIPYYNKYSCLISISDKRTCVEFWIRRINEYDFDMSYEDFIKYCNNKYEESIV